MKTIETPAQIWKFRPRHLLIVAILLLVLVAGLYVFAIQSDAYKNAEYFALTDPGVAKRTGRISSVGLRFLDGFHITYSGSGGDASFVIGLKGEMGESVLDVRLVRMANSWRVAEAYLSTPNEKNVAIISIEKVQ